MEHQPEGKTCVPANLSAKFKYSISLHTDPNKRAKPSDPQYSKFLYKCTLILRDVYFSYFQCHQGAEGLGEVEAAAEEEAAEDEEAAAEEEEAVGDTLLTSPFN